MTKDSVKDKLDGNELDLSLSSLTTVPVKEIASLPKATHIDLSCNLLTTLTLDFCALINVIKLDLSKNRLESLPDSFGDLQRLQSLDLYSNRLKTVPVSFFRLKNLKWLDLRDNPLCEELRSVAGDCLNETECKNCAKRVVAYMRNVQADQERKRQKRLQEDRELEASRKVEEELERQRKKAEKLKEKERKRREYAEKKAMEEREIVETQTTESEENKSTPVTNGSTTHIEKRDPVGLSCWGALLMSFMGLLLAITFSLYYCDTHPKDALCQNVMAYVKDFQNIYGGNAGLADNDTNVQYVPDIAAKTSVVDSSTDPRALAESMKILKKLLNTKDAYFHQYQELRQSKEGMTMDSALLRPNIKKNRYLDVLPYDQTRVKLKRSSGDYVNANFVNMEINGTEIVNRYIAAQGPLPNTCGDFWQMVWEQKSKLIVMLTTTHENGRVKCHQYWPNATETLRFGSLQVTSLREETFSSYVERDFTIVNVKAGKTEERQVRQMHYIAWPDHWVPDNSRDFLDFVLAVRQQRVQMVEPTVVHCSAGIGRTGVFISMETAMCLIEANSPVYPADIVRKMREQRVNLVQTPSQYKFVCESILRVYKEKTVQPKD